MTCVVDASVACKWFAEEKGSAEAIRLLESGEALVAPDLILAEVANSLWKKLRLGQLHPAQVEAAVEALPGFFDDLISGVHLASRSVAIAQVLDHSIHDCFYVALAELRNARLVTADEVLLARLKRTRWARLAGPE